VDHDGEIQAEETPQFASLTDLARQAGQPL
jgi:hypothetical protein